MVEENPDKDNIYDVLYDKYIGAEVIMDVPGEGPNRATVIHCFEDLDGSKNGDVSLEPTHGHLRVRVGT